MPQMNSTRSPQAETLRHMSADLADGRSRVVIEHVSPAIDCGRFAIKRIVGERIVVEADVFADGHVQLACQILYWRDREELQSSPMRPLGNDRWRGEFTVSTLGNYVYTVEAWVDRFQTWRTDLEKRVSAGQDIKIDLLIGAELIEHAAARATGADAQLLQQWARQLRNGDDQSSTAAVALDQELLDVMQRYPERDLATQYEKQFAAVVDRQKAVFSSW